MHKVLVVGGCGFLGYHLCNFLLKKKNYKIDIIDNFSKGKKDIHIKNLLKNPNVKLYVSDLSKNDIKIKQYNYDYIFQFAAILGVDRVINNPFSVLNKNYLIHLNVINFAKKQKNLKKFIFSSTSEVHIGNVLKNKLKFPTEEKHEIILENFEYPRLSYAISKIYCESILYHSKIPFSIIRPHNLYGERMGNLHVIPNLFERISRLKNGQVLNLNSYNHRRCFCYINDAVKQIYVLMKSKKYLNQPINIGNNTEEITILKLSRIIAKILDKKIKIKKTTKVNNSPKRRIPNLDRVNSIIKKQKYLNIQDGCNNLYKWQIKNKLI